MDWYVRVLFFGVLFPYVCASCGFTWGKKNGIGLLFGVLELLAAFLSSEALRISGKTDWLQLGYRTALEVAEIFVFMFAVGMWRTLLGSSERKSGWRDCVVEQWPLRFDLLACELAQKSLSSGKKHLETGAFCCLSARDEGLRSVAYRLGPEDSHCDRLNLAVLDKAVWEVLRTRVSGTFPAGAIQHLESFGFGDVIVLHQVIHICPKGLRCRSNLQAWE